MERFEIVDHTADIGIRAYGNSLGEAFANAAYGMFSLITDLDTVGETVCHTIEIEASDEQELLVSWLNELLYLLDTEGILFGSFQISTISNGMLQAKACGEKVKPSRHTIKTSIKAATYHMLSIERSDNGISVQVILDV